jgi:hypothetical protein
LKKPDFILESKENSLDSFIKNKIKKDSKSLRGRYPAFSEIVNGNIKTLKIRKIYILYKDLKDFFLFLTDNFNKKPKTRYFLGLSLASQSSDFLVALARDFAVENNLRLIQYSIYPKTLRINLIIIKELKSDDEFLEWIKILKDYKKKFVENK